MNALELADLLETTESTNNPAAAMLRQQAAEIEKLMSLVDIQKAVSRDVDIDFLNETINQQAAEIEAAIELVRKLQEEREALKKENERLFASMLTMALDEEVRKAQEQ
jgi:NADH:ubiquinone oxidoreductase subunit E